MTSKLNKLTNITINVKSMGSVALNISQLLVTDKKLSRVRTQGPKYMCIQTFKKFFLSLLKSNYTQSLK